MIDPAVHSEVPVTAALGDLDAWDGVTPEAFKTVFRYHPAGVAVITADGTDGPVALTATSVSSVSAVPPVLVFSVSESSSSTPTIREAETVVVHLLAAEQLDLALLGATSGVDRFEDSSLWTRLPSGEPVFHQADTWIRCRVVGQMPVGGSTIIAALAIATSLGDDPDAESARSVAPLVYHDRRWHRLGAASLMRTKSP